MVWIEDSEEVGAADENHLAHVGGLPTRDVVPHPGAAYGEKATVSQALAGSPPSSPVSSIPSHGP